MNSHPPSRGAIVLCGGKSTRMGQSKALLPFGPELMLQRVVRLLGELLPLKNIVVVAAVEQQLPQLPDDVAIARDRRPDRGPLEGLAAGLRTIDGTVAAAYVTSCDAPLLVPAFVERMFQLLGEREISVPQEEAAKVKFHHPLAAVYRTSLLPKVEQLLAADHLRPFYLFEKCDTLEVPVNELREVDPELRTLANCNRPEDYQAALARFDEP